MKTPNYEKAYKEALERAKMVLCNIPEGSASVRDIETIFPELVESEDEKIRKEIISALKWANHRGVYDKHIAYLEKQKINTEGDFGRGYDCGYEACLNSHGAEWLEKQKERKPVEWSEEDSKMLDKAIELTTESGWDRDKEKCLSWLKSLRPSWKPGEDEPEYYQHFDPDC